MNNKNTKGYIMKLRVMCYNEKSRTGELGIHALQRVRSSEKQRNKETQSLVFLL